MPAGPRTGSCWPAGPADRPAELLDHVVVSFDAVPTHVARSSFRGARDRQRWQARDNPLRLQADGNHLADQADDVLLVVGAIGVARDVAALVAADAILVDHPFQRGPVAQAVVERLRGNAGQRQEVVVLDCVAVLAKLHRLDAPVERRLGILDVLERIRLLLLVIHVQVDQFPAGLGESVEIGRLARERNAWQLALEVLGKSRAILGMVQHRVNVMENVLPRDRLVAVVFLEVLQREERNVVLPPLPSSR